MATSTITVHRVFRAPQERVYRAWLDVEALVKWLPPNGFTGKVHHADVKVGGDFKISFTNIAMAETHAFGGTYLELVPHERIRYTNRFTDPNLPGELVVTVTLQKGTVGTELRLTQENIPAIIPLDACYLGWQESLELLRLLVEREPS